MTHDRGGEGHAAEHTLMETDEPQVLVDVPEAPEDLAVAAGGLERRPGTRKRVVIVGGGLAGLVAAYVLEGQGHEPIVLEAQNRVGGRIYTLRDFAPGLYAEAGGRRIPRVHDLTLRYCEQFKLELRPFVMGNPKGLVHIGGVRMTAAEAQVSPERLPYELADHERGKSADQLWEAATAEIREMIESAGDEAWAEIVRRYDQYSLYEFLKVRGFSEEAIEFYAVMNFVEADMHNAVVEILREDLGGAYVDMSTIAGGMDRLPNAFYQELEGSVRFGTEVRSIEQDDDGVRLRCRVGRHNLTLNGDYAICTLPFSVLRTVEHRFSHDKERAIRQLNYHASTKILLQVAHRFWEEEDGIEGGATVTDLPIRRLNYPPSDPTTARGVLLASYTWGQDALQWGAMAEDERIE